MKKYAVTLCFQKTVLLACLLLVTAEGASYNNKTCIAQAVYDQGEGNHNALIISFKEVYILKSIEDEDINFELSLRNELLLCKVNAQNCLCQYQNDAATLFQCEKLDDERVKVSFQQRIVKDNIPCQVAKNPIKKENESDRVSYVDLTYELHQFQPSSSQQAVLKLKPQTENFPSFENDLKCFVHEPQRLNQELCIIDFQKKSIEVSIPHEGQLTLRLTGSLISQNHNITRDMFQAAVMYKSSRLLFMPEEETIIARYLLPAAGSDGTISPVQAMIQPLVYSSGQTSLYTISFIPQYFEQGMYIRLTLPSQISFPTNQNTYVCKGINGTDQQTLNCFINRNLKQLTVQNGFTNTTVKPNLIKFTVSSLQNPTSSFLTTDSFVLETFTYFGTKRLDAISTFLTVSFNCTSPCKTCSGNKTVCTSCEGLAPEKYLLNNECITSCPNHQYGDSLNVCFECSSKCVTCSGTSTFCTSCATGYALSDTGACVNTSILFSRYYFYFSGLGVAISLFVLIIKICAQSTDWLHSTIALAALPEIVAWGFLSYLYFIGASFFHIIFCFAAAGVHVILNIIYGLVHQKMIIHQSGSKYKELVLDYHCWNTVSIVLSFGLTFKFHLLQMSQFGGAHALSGDWSYEVWGVWNMMSMTYLISCYTIMMGSCAYFIFQNMDRQEEWIWNASLDVAGLSTYIAFLLIIQACCFCKRPEPIKASEEKNSNSALADMPYNKVDDKSSTALFEKAFSKLPQIQSIKEKQAVGKFENAFSKLPQIQPLKSKVNPLPFERSVSNKRPMNMTDRDRTQSEEDFPLPSKRSVGPLPNKKDPFATQPDKGRSDLNSARRIPPPMTTSKPKVESPPPTPKKVIKEKEKPLPQPQPQPQVIIQQLPPQYPPQPVSKSSDKEDLILRQYMELLKQEKDMLKDERIGMMQDRQRLLEQDMQRQKEYMNMQYNIHKNQDMLAQERMHLEQMRRQFLEEMDNRLKQRLDNFDQRRPTPPRNNQTKTSTFTYTYSPEVSMYDKKLQTDVTKSQVRDMKVQVGSEVKQMKNLQTQTMSKPSQPITEFPSEFEDTDIQDQTIPKHDQDVQVTEPRLSEESIKPKPKPRYNPDEAKKLKVPMVEQDIQTSQQKVVPPPPVVKPPTPQVRPNTPVVRGPIQNNKPQKAVIEAESLELDQKHDTEIGPINQNPSYFRKNSNDQLKRSENFSQMEPPSKENFPMFRNITPGGKDNQFERELTDALIEPLEKNKAFKEQLDGKDGGLPEIKEQNDEQVEPIVGNKPHYRNISPINPGQGGDSQLPNRSVNESMIEAIKGNDPLFNRALHSRFQEVNESALEPFKDNNPVFNQDEALRHQGQTEDERQDSMIEPIVDNQASKEVMPTYWPFSGESEKEMRESMIEPITGNKPHKEKDLPDKIQVGDGSDGDGKNREKERNEAMIEPIKENKPIFKEKVQVDDGKLGDREKNESMIEPIKDNKPLYQDKSQTGVGNQREKNDSMIEPIKGNKPLFQDKSQTGVGNQREKNDSMIEAIKDNKPLFKEQTERGSELNHNREKNDSMIEPIRGNQPIFTQNQGDEIQSEREKTESQMEPIKDNKALFRDSVQKGLESEVEKNDNMIEPIKGNNPVFRESALKDGMKSEAEKQDSMIEPIKGNKSLFRDSQKGLESEVEKNESMMEPIKGNKPLFRDSQKGIESEVEKKDSMMESIKGNKPFYMPKDKAQVESEKEKTDSLIEPIKGNKPVAAQSALEMDKDDNMSQLESGPKKQALFKTVYSQAQEESHMESTEDMNNNPPPVFEKLKPQEHTKEDYEVHQTEVPQLEDEVDEVHNIEEVKQQPLAKKIKKILYSDKSESSIDEMMEDTPSNYNIPNGRLDGRSLGLKAILLHERKNKKEQARGDPLADASGRHQKTLQPVQSDHLNNKQGVPANTGHQYFSPIRGAVNLPGDQSSGKVNNLFQDDSEANMMVAQNLGDAPTRSQIGLDLQNKQPNTSQDAKANSNSYTTGRQQNRNEPTFNSGIGAIQNQTFGEDDTYLVEEQETFGSKSQLKKRKPKDQMSKKVFKEAEGSGSGMEEKNSPRQSPFDNGINPYSIKTAVPQLSNKPPKLGKR